MVGSNQPKKCTQVLQMQNRHTRLGPAVAISGFEPFGGLEVGTSINVGYHGASATQAVVCTASLTQKGVGARRGLALERWNGHGPI